MNFSLSEEQLMIKETIKKMGERHDFRELAKKIDETCEFPHHLMDVFAEVGFLGMTLSPEYGGGGQPAINAIIAIEELAKYSPMVAAPVFESNVGPVRVVDLFGSEEQKKSIIPGVCRGENSVSVCMTEPEAGSDLTALKTRLDKNGDGYVLNGQKSFITGAGVASHYMVYTRFGETKGYKGIGGVIVEKDMPGFSLGKQEKYMGLHGMPSCDLFFDDVKIPAENIIIKEGQFKDLMTTFDIERCGNAAMCLGVAGGAIEETRKYALERHAFGRPICEFQDLQFTMADMTMKLEAARLLVHRAATGAGRGLPSIYEASLGKCYANEMVIDVTNKAIQLFGGYGYSTEFPMERMLRDGRAWSVAGGTLQMLKITMASFIFGRRFDQRR